MARPNSDFLYRVAKGFRGGKIGFSTNGMKAVGYPYGMGESFNLSLIFY
jgi:hypothetical protein